MSSINYYITQGFHQTLCFSLKCCDFFNSARSASALVFYLPGVCTHTDTEGKQRKARVQNILKCSEKTQYYSECRVRFQCVKACARAFICQCALFVFPESSHQKSSGFQSVLFGASSYIDVCRAFYLIGYLTH